MSEFAHNPLFADDSVAQTFFIDAPAAYSVIDSSGTQVAANRQFCELFRYPEGTLLTAEALTDLAYRAETARYIEEFSQGASHNMVIEKRYVRSDGTTFWGRLNTRRIEMANGEFYMLGIIEDIGSQVDLENDLRAAAKDQSEFVAHVSHELRNPLHTISGLAELLTASGIDPQSQRQAGIIMREARNLTSIVSDLLDIGKYGTGNLVIDSAPFSVRGVIDRSVRGAQTDAAAKRLQLNTTVDDALPIYAIGDAGRVGQIVDNLLGNAIKFTSRGSVAIDVRRGVDDHVEFAVIDTGTGVPQHRQSDIFEPFRRLNASAPGAGLGLAISSRLAELMSGELRLEDSGPHGSTFVLSVPLEETTTAPPMANASATTHTTKEGRVLVVEDSLENQMLAAAQLNRLGYEFDVVDDGYRALEITAETSYAAILMDWHLPGIDGLETTRRIRKREERGGLERTPIISVTARAMVADIEACRDAGADDFVAKPASLDRIGEVLGTWIQRPPGDDEPVEAAVVGEAFSNLLEDLGDPELVCSLARTFLEELPRRVAIIVDSENDTDAAQLAAHTLKSTSAMVGAERLRVIASQIEDDAGKGCRITEQIHTDLRRVADETRTEVLQFVERLESAG